jgi:chemotaxis signal transduction protein
VPESEIKVNSTIQTRIKETYLGGFLHSSDQITIIVDMQKLLDEDEFNQVNHIVQRAG